MTNIFKRKNKTVTNFYYLSKAIPVEVSQAIDMKAEKHCRIEGPPNQHLAYHYYRLGAEWMYLEMQKQNVEK